MFCRNFDIFISFLTTIEMLEEKFSFAVLSTWSKPSLSMAKKPAFPLWLFVCCSEEKLSNKKFCNALQILTIRRKFIHGVTRFHKWIHRSTELKFWSAFVNLLNYPQHSFLFHWTLLCSISTTWNQIYFLYGKRFII